MFNELNNEHFRKRAVVVVAILALFGIGALLYNSGWSQGFAMGLLTGGAGGADGAAAAPYLAYRGGPGMFHGGFGFFGFVFRIFFFVLLIAFLAKLFGFFRRHRYGEPGPWAHEHWHHGPWGEQPQQQPSQPPAQGDREPSGRGSPDQPGEGGPQPVSWTKL